MFIWLHNSLILEYSSGNKKIELDCVYNLQNDDEMFKTGKFEDKNEEIDCTRDSLPYRKLDHQTYDGPFWGYYNITAKEVKCLKFHGVASALYQNLRPTQYK